MRVLIVEDEAVIALEIESIILDRLPDAETVVAHSVQEAFAEIDRIELAFLDIDVTDGKTYPLALELRLRNIPFVFISGADRFDAPEDLRQVHLVPKPFAPNDIDKLVADFTADLDRSPLIDTHKDDG